MLDFYNYLYVLFTFFTLLILLDIIAIFNNKKLIYLRYQNFFLFIFLGVYYILLATRDLGVGTDTDRYVSYYRQLYLFNDLSLSSDIGFNFLNKILVTLKISPEFYLFYLSLLFVIPIYFTFKSFKNINKVFLLWFFVSLFIFVSMSTNILRQGIGGAFAMWGVSLFLNRENNNKKFIYPLIVAPLFHLSLILVIGVFFVSKYFKNLKLLYIILFLCIVFSYSGFNLNNILGDMPVIGAAFSDRMDVYLNTEISKYQIGFRLDFLLFNLFFIYVAHYISTLKFVKQYYPKYHQIQASFIVLTSYFILMFNVPYSDRFGILSWIFIPFIMYPIFDLSTFKFNKLKLGVFVLGISLFIVFNVISV